MKRSIISKFLCAILAVSLLSGCSLISGLMPTEPTQPQTPPDFSGIVDFVIHAEEGREFRILQITDTQIEDASKDRIPDRITDSTPLTEEELYSDVFYYIDEAVKEAQPDLILMTGDNIAGMFDDDGWCTLQLVDFMESLEIPWAPIFGNHDNETAMGVTWQCQQFENAENCLFKRGDITGNSNYTIGIEQGGNVIKILYMMDSNGCQFGYTYSPLPSFGTINAGEKIKESNGFAEDQVQWIADTSAKITDGLGYTPSKFLAIHINLKEYADGLIAKGYMTNDRLQKFTINDPTGEDFGNKYDLAAGFSADGLWDVLKAQKFDGVFAGHEHANNYSIVYEGIRLTQGTKTGYFAYHREGQVGGTLITVASGGSTFRVEHIYSDPYAGPSHA